MNEELDVPIPEAIPLEQDKIGVGQWYWVSGKNDDSSSLACVMKVGSNYFKLETPHTKGQGYRHYRIHDDDFHDRCTLEPNPEDVIRERIDHYRQRAANKMIEIQEITKRLGVAPRDRIEGPHDDTNTAMVAFNGKVDMNSYKESLIKAEKDELPALFKGIKEDNEQMARWMSAEMLPAMAVVEGMSGVTGRIQDRIFNVQLYAGLSEEVELIREGEPAPIDTRLHVMQRRCYMDEECLANYDVGGMEYKNICEFDKWLARDDNMYRILPFDRCIAIFRVRRNDKKRYRRISAFVEISLQDADKKTFMYLRNGDRLYRMTTDLEFDHKIFPDVHEFGAKRMWARMSHRRVDGFITEDSYQEMVREREEKKKKLEEWKAANPGKSTWYAPYELRGTHYSYGNEYEPFDQTSVYYDDMCEKMEQSIKKYNRMAMIIQGLYDRSEVFHPHASVRLWEAASFAENVELVYDSDRALYPTEEPPDFEAYRAKLNASLKVGSITVGQQRCWEVREAEKESKRMDNSWREREYPRPEIFHPYGDPGPGYLAIVKKMMPRAKKCTYEWYRAPRGRDTWGKPDIKCKLTVKHTSILNVDAYTPGDYKIFFADPRTREKYIQWAPLLMAAEDYHAGKRKVDSH